MKRLVVLVLEEPLPCHFEDWLKDLISYSDEHLTGPVPGLWEPEEIVQTMQEALMNEED